LPAGQRWKDNAMWIRNFAMLTSAAILAACGGDDLGSPAPPVDQPPDFGVNALDLTFPENSTAAITTLVVDDETVNDITFSLSGADVALFSISGTGELRFVNPPDFENPQDEGGGNVYELIVTASDRGNNASTLTITVQVTDDATAMRFVDEVFATVEPRGTVTLAAASGNLPVTLLAPAGDTMLLTPLVVVGGEDSVGLAATAEAFARRGYLVASVPSVAEADLEAIALALRDNAVAGLGVDTAAIAVAGTGAAAENGALAATFAGSGIPVFALGANVPVADAAAHFHSQLMSGAN
jgi:hypothetical protein